MHQKDVKDIVNHLIDQIGVSIVPVLLAELSRLY